MSGKTQPDLGVLAEGIRHGDRVAIGRALTLVESRRDADQERAASLLDLLTPLARPTRRIGVTGTPGAGKSTFVDAYGHRIAEAGGRVAVLAIDPSSARSGGSLLGDKTRMARLAVHPHAFIRPSPTRGRLGGIAQYTHDALVVLEAAGYDTLFVETVGVGQSETAVAQVTDCVLMLVVPGGGDEVQGLKRGILEHIDFLVVHKADLDAPRTREAVRAYRAALHLFAPRSDGWMPRVLAASSTSQEGYDALDSFLDAFFDDDARGRAIEARRQEQRRILLSETLRELLMERFLARTGQDDALLDVNNESTSVRRLALDLLNRPT